MVILRFNFSSLNAGSDEQKFLEASMAYVSGKPILSDKEYDELKMRLKVCSCVLFYILGKVLSIYLSVYDILIYIPGGRE